MGCCLNSTWGWNKVRWFFFYKSPKSIIQESGLIHQYILNVVRPYNQYMRMSIVIEGNRPPLFFVSVWASIFWLACLIWVFGDWIHTLVYLLSWSEKRKMKKICFCVVKVSLFYHSCNVLVSSSCNNKISMNLALSWLVDKCHHDQKFKIIELLTSY